MKKIIIFDCGPSLKEVSKKYGFAPEWIMTILKNIKYNFKWIKSYAGESINSNEGDAWIITGSPKSVYEEKKWMIDLENIIVSSIKYNTPILGICFGHQLIAKAFGGLVMLNKKGWELGGYPIFMTKDGEMSPILYGISNNSIVYQSHQDSIDILPDSAKKLAYNDKGIQAFVINNNIYGVQFHPEFSWEIINEYVLIRANLGAKVDNYNVPISTEGKKVLHNFIKIIS